MLLHGIDKNKHYETSLLNITLLMTTLEAFQLRSLGIRPWGASSTRTAAETLVTIAGGLGNVLSSVKFNWMTNIDGRERVMFSSFVYWQSL